MASRSNTPRASLSGTRATASWRRSGRSTWTLNLSAMVRAVRPAATGSDHADEPQAPLAGLVARAGPLQAPSPLARAGRGAVGRLRLLPPPVLKHPPHGKRGGTSRGPHRHDGRLAG